MSLARTMQVGLVVVSLVAGSVRRSAAENGVVASQEQSAKAKAAVVEAEEELRRVSALVAQGVAIPESKFHRAQIDLAEARIRLAALQRQQPAVVSNLETIVHHWEHYVDRAKGLSERGAIPSRRLNEARVELAKARARLESHRIVLLREQELHELVAAAKSGAVSQLRVEEARTAFEEAHNQELVRADLVQPFRKGPEVDDRIAELLKERLLTVAEIHRGILDGYAKGEVSVDQVLQAKIELLNAKLDLTATSRERSKFYEEAVATAEEWLKLVVRMAEDKQASPIDVSKAKAFLLKARIGWEKAKESE